MAEMLNGTTARQELVQVHLADQMIRHRRRIHHRRLPAAAAEHEHRTHDRAHHRRILARPLPPARALC